MKLNLKTKSLVEATEAEKQQIKDIVDDAVTDPNIDKKEVAKDVESAVDKFDISPDEVYDATGDIERNLEAALKIARREKRNNGKEPLNICLIGDAGVGKTSRFWTWAHQHPEINILFHDAKSMDELDFKGKFINKEDPKDVKYSAVRSDEFDEMEEGEWVLFLDEYNRAKSNVRASLLTLIRDHEIPDPSRKDHVKELKGFLFAVIAINPTNESYNIKDYIDSAEKTRWKRVLVGQSLAKFKNYILNSINNRLKIEDDEEERKAWAWRAQIAEKILDDPRFHFDTPEEIAENSLSEDSITNYRSLKSAIFSSYDLEDFYDNFEGTCNPAKLPVIKAILGNFRLNDDKATQVLAAHNSRSMFTEE